MTEKDRAMQLMRRLEGTVIADLRSLLAWAQDFENHPSRATGLGGLNFTLPLVSLIACEVYGYYLCGAARHQGRKSPANVDTGYYLMAFIQRYFRRESYFKKLVKVFADYLRHDLVHGFGSSPTRTPFEIMLFIQTSVSGNIFSGIKRRKRTIALNSVALAEQTIHACAAMKKQIEKDRDSALLANVLKAMRKRFRAPAPVVSQFEAVFNETQRKGLVLPTGRRKPGLSTH